MHVGENIFDAAFAQTETRPGHYRSDSRCFLLGRRQSTMCFPTCAGQRNPDAYQKYLQCLRRSLACFEPADTITVALDTVSPPVHRPRGRRVLLWRHAKTPPARQTHLPLHLFQPRNRRVVSLQCHATTSPAEQ